MMSSLFFFFKQKTAYDLRISDWSSDVCSSDLDRRSDRIDRGRMAGASGRNGRRAVSRHADEPARAATSGNLFRHDPASPERKSVVSGKSVSVRLDLGGRRIIKNKKIEED